MVWTAGMFAHAKAVHVIGGRSIVIDTADVVIDLSDLALTDAGEFVATVKTYSRFTERCALAAADPGGQRPH